jgi:hypothetical protein
LRRLAFRLCLPDTAYILSLLHHMYYLYLLTADDLMSINQVSIVFIGIILLYSFDLGLVRFLDLEFCFLRFLLVGWRVNRFGTDCLEVNRVIFCISCFQLKLPLSSTKMVRIIRRFLLWAVFL